MTFSGPLLLVTLVVLKAVVGRECGDPEDPFFEIKKGVFQSNGVSDCAKEVESMLASELQGVGTQVGENSHDCNWEECQQIQEGLFVRTCE